MPIADELPGQALLERLRAEGRLKPDPGLERGRQAEPPSYRRILAACDLDAAGFADLVSESSRLPRARLAELLEGEPLVALFSPSFLAEAGIFPYRRSTGQAALAVADPSAADILAAVELTIGGDVVLEIASFDEIDIALRRATGDEGDPSGGPGSDTTGDAEDVERLRDLASGAPVIRALDALFERAAGLRATDIHIEPLRNQFQVRLRIDGVLRPCPAPPGTALRALVSRIKIVAGLNIAERRLPQDGRAQVKLRGRELDVRVATMPTTQGEAAILRLLERGGRLTEFDQLGFSARDFTVIRRQLAAPYGLVLVTGPTGSGKTTTLAAALTVLNDASRKILTIEDPVEYEIPGVAQSHVRPAIGLSFATALRAFLRQDPDVIMVGEMRDTETARICIQASLTGHLVLSTLHTNSAASAVTRLMDMGVEPYLLATSLATVIAQRLVRVLCPDCRRETELSQAMVGRDPRYAAAGLKAGVRVFEPVGCDRCGGAGYRGRRAIFEVVDITEPMRRLIVGGAGDGDIELAARSDGMATMLEDGLAKAMAGMTSVEEVFRVASVR